MKKMVILLMIGMLVFCITACGKSSANSGRKEKNQLEDTQKNIETDSEQDKGNIVGKNEDGYIQISMDEATKLMKTEKDYIILDVRMEEEFASGHIPGAICVPNETIENDDIKELPNKDQLILVYCRSGNRSKQASKKLVKFGYTNIVEFGGILDWTGDIEK